MLELRPEIEAALEMDFANQDISEEQMIAYSTIGGAPHLDGEYTVFGQVVEGLSIVDSIAALEVDSVNNPLDPVFMIMSIEPVLKDSMTAWYGIEYPEPDEEIITYEDSNYRRQWTTWSKTDQSPATKIRG